MAAIHQTANDGESMPFFDHWWSEVSASDELKQVVLKNIR
jgi:hypothetical protein